MQYSVKVTDSSTPPSEVMATIDVDPITPLALNWSNPGGIYNVPQQTVPQSDVGDGSPGPDVYVELDISGGVSRGLKPYSFTGTNLSPYTISSAGVITGTISPGDAAQIAKTATITVTDTEDSTGATRTLDFTITVGAILGELTFTDSADFDIPELTAPNSMTPIDVSVGVAGGNPPYTYSATGLGQYTINSTTGVISGTTTEAQAENTAGITVKDTALA